MRNKATRLHAQRNRGGRGLRRILLGLLKAQQAAELALKALLKALRKPAFGHNLVFQRADRALRRRRQRAGPCVGYL